jgi:hypothetical protein
MITESPVNESIEYRPRFRLRFSLLSLLILVTAACLLLGWAFRPIQVRATALFHVSNRPQSIFGDNGPGADKANFELVKKTQIALLESDMVLSAAARKPGIASLQVLRGREPTAWLAENLEVGFPNDSELLSISLVGPDGFATDLATLVDAVANAYQDEVLYKEKQRHFSERDMAASTLSQLNKEIKDKRELFRDIASESSLEGNSALNREVLMRRLDRIESELIRLEDEQLRLQTSGDSGNTKFYEERLKQLRDQQAETEKNVARSGLRSPDMAVMESELNQLQRVADDLAVRLEMLNVESNAPPRIQQLQPAVVSPAD